MSESESQFILAAYRPDGSDAEDPAMKEALEQLESQPELKERFEQQLAFDRAVAAAVSDIPIPPTLRSDILAGARVSGSRSSGRFPFSRVTAIAAAAAALAAIAGVVIQTSRPDPQAVIASITEEIDRSGWEAGNIALLNSMMGGGAKPELTGATPERTVSWLRETFGTPVALPAGLEKSPSAVCKHVQLDGGKVALVCFRTPDNAMVHLTIFEGKAPSDGAQQPQTGQPVYARHDSWMTAAWSEGKHRFLLATADDSPRAKERLASVFDTTT